MDHADFERIVGELDSARDADGLPYDLDSIIISAPDRSFQYRFRETSQLTDIRSISKVAVSIALGTAMARGLRFRGGLLSLDTEILPFFEERSSNVASGGDSPPVQIRHILSNTVGHQEGFLFRKDVDGRDPADLLDYVLSMPIVHRPGTHFSYSNAGWYLISALIERELGTSLSEWVAELVFSPLEISSFEWKRYGDFDIGGSGLCMSNTDLHKLGRLFFSDGRYRNVQVVPSEWLQSMREPVVLVTSGQDHNRTLQYAAYGYAIWSTANGIFYCDGSAGQYLIMIPGSDLVISTVGNVTNMNPISFALRDLLG
jgi:CubicO group peptidase (beta-lactamase class C family)